MNPEVLEWIGYIASAIIAFSMFMTSIVKFRWINFVGGALFSLYGFLLGSLPVGILNGIIAVTDLYYLYTFYSRKDVFEVLEVRPQNRYMQRFIDYHIDDIHGFLPNYQYTPTPQTISYLILRNMAVAGIFIAQKTDEQNISVELDYVIREYRDFKNGKYVYFWLSNNLAKSGITKVWSNGDSPKYIKYLKLLGFTEIQDNKFVKELK